MTTITDLRVFDLRFPTSASLDGSDAMNPDPDYSAAYVILGTDGAHEGHGLTFTIGRGNEVVCAAIKALRTRIVGLDLAWIAENPGRFWRHVTGDSQLRWIGPDKGAMHLATGAVVNAVWDLLAKDAGKPVWQFVADMTPEQLVSIIDFRYLTDAITPDEALAIFRKAEAGKAERIATLKAEGYQCYTTSAGWLGYSNEKLTRLATEAVEAGLQPHQDEGRPRPRRRYPPARNRPLHHGAGPFPDDRRQPGLGSRPGHRLGQGAVAASIPISSRSRPAPTTSPATAPSAQAIAPVKVATGEMCQNRILFKQFIKDGAIDIVQIDACRIGGLNEVLSVLLMAAKYDLPVWPHAGGVGLCEYVQHLSMIDYLVVSGTKTGRVIEYVDHLHEHFLDPCIIQNAAYMPPAMPGFSIQMKPDSIAAHEFRG